MPKTYRTPKRAISALKWSGKYNMPDFSVVTINRGMEHNIRIIDATAIELHTFLFSVYSPEYDRNVDIPYSRIISVYNRNTFEQIYHRTPGKTSGVDPEFFEHFIQNDTKQL